MTARAERIAILIEDGQLTTDKLQAIAADGNELDCGTANVLGLPFEAWLRWGQQPNATTNAQRWAATLLAELDELG
jgi:hypothetical protein